MLARKECLHNLLFAAVWSFYDYVSKEVKPLKTLDLLRSPWNEIEFQVVAICMETYFQDIRFLNSW